MMRSKRRARAISSPAAAPPAEWTSKPASESSSDSRSRIASSSSTSRMAARSRVMGRRCSTRPPAPSPRGTIGATASRRDGIVERRRAPPPAVASRHPALAAVAPVLVLLVDQAHVVERLRLRRGRRRLRHGAELADAGAERLGDLLERRQVVAAGERAGLRRLLGLGHQLQRGLAADAAAPDDVLDARRQGAELVLLGVEHLE